METNDVAAVIPATQVRNPAAAIKRTLAQVIGAATVVIPVLLLILQYAVEELVLPPAAVAWIAGAAVALAAVAAFLAKVMAIPLVNDWLTRHARPLAAPALRVRVIDGADTSAKVADAGSALVVRPVRTRPPD